MAYMVILGEGDLDRLIRRLGPYSHQRNVLDASDGPLAAAANIIKSRAQLNVLASPSKRQNAKRGKPSLRRAIASSIVVKKSHTHNASTVSVFVDPSQMPTGKKGLASLYEGVSEWHHPVYGHEPIVFQAPHPYFGHATTGIQVVLDVAANRVIDKIAHQIDA